MVRKKTSIVVDEKIWSQAKIHCIKKKKDLSQLIEELLKKELKLVK